MTADPGARTRRPAFVIDAERCIGCWACAVACRARNALATGEWWVRIESLGGGVRDTLAGVFPDVAKGYRPVIERCACAAEDLERAATPACAAACPTRVFSFGDAAERGGEVARALRDGRAAPVDADARRAVEVWYLSGPARSQRRSGPGSRRASEEEA